MGFSQLIRSGKFPEAVQQHLPTWCPSHLDQMMENDSIHPDLLVDHVTTKTKHRSLRNLLNRGTVTTYTKIIDSRERRDAILGPVLHRTKMNAAAQLKFATKAVSTNIADEFLSANWSTDEARAKIALRATPEKVVSWLASGADLDDDSVLKILLAVGERHPANPFSSSDSESAIAVLCASRPAIRSKLMEDLPFTMLAPVIASGFTRHDEAVFLQRAATAFETSSHTATYVCSTALTQPSLSKAAAAEIYDLAARHKELRSLVQRDVWLPESEMFLGTPLDELTDELAAARILMQVSGYTSSLLVVQYAQLAMSPAVRANAKLAYRVSIKTTEIARRREHLNAFAYKALQVLQDEVTADMSEFGPWHSGIEHWTRSQTEKDKERRGIKDAEDYVRLRHTNHANECWWHDDRRMLDSNWIGSQALENLRGPEGYFDATRHLTESFGDGSDEESLALWRTAMVMLPKHKGTLRQLVNSVRGLQV